MNTTAIFRYTIITKENATKEYNRQQKCLFSKTTQTIKKWQESLVPSLRESVLSSKILTFLSVSRYCLTYRYTKRGKQSHLSVTSSGGVRLSLPVGGVRYQSLRLDLTVATRAEIHLRTIGMKDLVDYTFRYSAAYPVNSFTAWINFHALSD